MAVRRVGLPIGDYVLRSLLTTQSEVLVAWTVRSQTLAMGTALVGIRRTRLSAKSTTVTSISACAATNEAADNVFTDSRVVTRCLDTLVFVLQAVFSLVPGLALATTALCVAHKVTCAIGRRAFPLRTCLSGVVILTLTQTTRGIAKTVALAPFGNAVPGHRRSIDRLTTCVTCIADKAKASEICRTTQLTQSTIKTRFLRTLGDVAKMSCGSRCTDALEGISFVSAF